MIRSASVRITDRTRALMQQALDMNLLDQGRFGEALEERIAEWFGVKYAIATANGTLADACALSAIKYLDTNHRNEIIVPALTFIAQINAVVHSQLKPVFVDASFDGNIDVEQIESKITDKTLAIMPVHLLGRPAKMREINALAKKYNLYIVEDACEAMGSTYFGQKVGTIGDVGCFSFYVSHTLATGEGGMIITNNEEIANLAKSLRNHGRQSEQLGEKFVFPYIGFSGKMNCMEAIIGLGGMENINQSLITRRSNAFEINSISGIASFFENEGECIVPHGYPAMAQTYEQRQELLSLFMEKYHIESRQIFCSIPTQTGAYEYLDDKGAYPVAEEIGRRGIYLPTHDGLTHEDVRTIATAIKQENLDKFGK